MNNSDLKKSLTENQIVMITIPTEGYWEKLLIVLKTLTESVRKVVYVTLNKPYTVLVKDLKASGLPENKFVFIDALTQPTIGSTKTLDFIYVSDPKSLTDISIYSFEKLGKTGSDALLVDSLSHLLVYNPEHSVLKFVSFITSKIKLTRHTLILLAMREDTDKGMFADVKMFCDKVIEM